MGTKNEPGAFDCYANAKDDEPLFTLLARDPLAPALVDLWAERRQAQRVDSAEKVDEARACAEAMHVWYRAHHCTQCGHPGDRHTSQLPGEVAGCGGPNCYGFRPDLDRPIAPPRRGEWLLLLVCCGRPDGYQVVETEAEINEFTVAYTDAGGHVRTVIASKLTHPVRVGFHDDGDPDIATARPPQHPET